MDRENVDPADDTVPPVLKLDACGVELSACAVQRGGRTGLMITGVGAPAVRGCVFRENGASGILVEGAGAAPRLTNNECSENGNSGIWVYGKGASPSLLDNQCLKNAQAGICFDGGAEGLARGNVCSGNLGSGMVAQGDNTRPAFENNECKDNKQNGIWWDDTSFPTIMGCTLENNGCIGRADVGPLLSEERFAELEALASRLRAEKVQCVAQERRITFFYHCLEEGWGDAGPGNEDAYIKAFEHWRAAYPKSLAAHVGLANAHIRLGWKARGTGFANTVTDEGWKVFRAETGKAWSILLEADKLDEKDPYLYEVLVDASSWTGRDEPSPLGVLATAITGIEVSDADIDKYFRKGVALDPLYLPLYTRRVVSLLPRWGGRPAELERFAETSAKNVPPAQSDALYALIAYKAISCERLEDYQSRYNFSWPRIQQGFRNILTMLPDSTAALHKLCYAACVYKDQQTAAELFKKMDEDEDSEEWGSSTLFAAFRKWALDNGDYPQRPALIAAIHDNDVEEAGRLIEAGADVNARDLDGDTALRNAVGNRSLKAVRLLLDHGADPNLASEDGWTPLALAAGQRFPEIVELLVERGADVNTRLGSGASVMRGAVAWGFPDIALILLRHGADPNIGREGSYSALMVAVQNGQMELIRELIERGADPNAVTSGGWSVLEEAVDQGNAEAVRLLLEKGADVNYQEKDGWSALHAATRGETTEALEILLAVKGVDINLKLGDLDTPLHAAAKKGMTKAAEVLLNAGAEVNPRNKEGLTPLGLAKAGKYDSTVALLAKHGGVE